MLLETNLGVLYKNRGQYDKAEPIFNKALEIWEEYDRNHANVAKILNNQGTLYQELGQIEKSKARFQRALTVLRAQKVVLPDELATCLNNLAMVQVELKEYKEAEENLELSINVFERAFGASNAFVARPLHNLSNLYLCEARVDKALEVAERAEETLCSPTWQGSSVCRDYSKRHQHHSSANE